MAEEEGEVQVEAEKASPMKMMLILLVAAVVLVAMTVAGMFFMLKATGMLNGGGGGGGAAKAHASKTTNKPAIYQPLDPAFVVNINDHGRMRYLQVSMEAMTRDPAIVEELTKHMPLIRNNLVLLLSGQTVEDLHSAEGKELIRQRALEEVQRVLEEEIGDKGIEAIYITSLVIQ